MATCWLRNTEEEQRRDAKQRGRHINHQRTLEWQKCQGQRAEWCRSNGHDALQGLV